MSIKNYKTFINESSSSSKLTAEQIYFLDKYVIGKWHMNDDGFVDVDGVFDCSNKGISDFKGIKFGNVDRHFNCADNKLTSLEGGPKEVGGSFYCSHNKITSLEFGPKEVGGHFYCNHNNITSLEGCPKEVGGSFNCSYNNLTSLEFGPKEVKGYFNCSYNNLSSLEGGPKEVDGSFNCSDNNLISLEGAPIEIGREFYLDHNEGASSETLKSIYSKMKEAKSDYKTVLKSLWKEISIEDKILLYTPDLDWVEEDEAAKLSNLKKYNSIKKMI
jgi:hypothetical protein